MSASRAPLAARAAGPTAFRRRWTWRTTLWVTLAGWSIAAALRVVYWTLRIRLIDHGNLVERRRHGQAMIVAFWHDGIPLMPLMFARVGWPGRATVLLSWHRDAEIAARAIARFGIASAHGSSTRGWVGGLRALLGACARGDDLVVVPDGPRGPRHRAKDGVVQLARATGLPVVAFGVAAWPVRRLGSWDRMQVPRPFGRVAIVTTPPIELPSGDAGAAVAVVQAALERVTAEAAAAAGATPAEMGEAS